MKLGSFRGVAVLGLFTVAIATSTSALAPSGDGLGTANGPDGGTNNNKYHDADAPDESLLEQIATAFPDNGEIKDEEKKDVIYPARTTRQRGNTEGELLVVESEEEEKQLFETTGAHWDVAVDPTATSQKDWRSKAQARFIYRGFHDPLQFSGGSESMERGRLGVGLGGRSALG
ncbi:hypothetical protein THAOC_21808 [Thalassiosira oceanica]|uniref:RxLR effector protein n=1 Tax=Thalassiosira oceanica TaxID=159749 RepID=K0RYJ1_THAOC|nr:hypothetical protein THAOC_21808 [Thalassiosira oceanica]|eukprot:EJK58090.1 hypothetical protein THAOC_21808 [Thalassiosira oceanica]